MAYNSKIEWTDHTFNPWIGCTKISPACDNCYAERQDHRFGGGHWGPGAERKLTKQGNWDEPRHWDKQAESEGARYRVFCASMADVFDLDVPQIWRENLWSLIRETPNLDWLLLTKRIGNAEAMLPANWGDGWANVWLGATVVTQEEADRDIPKLLDTPAAVRFVSAEPLLGPIDLRGKDSQGSALDSFEEDPKVDWVIVGGESGPQARPMHPDWVRSLRDQCREAEVPFFFKQWGEWLPRVTGDPDEYHEGMKVWRVEHPLGCEVEAGIAHVSEKVGKKAAGRQLDGEIWEQVPGREVEA